MEKAVNLGAGWRIEVTQFLAERGMEVLNPCLFEADQLKGIHPDKLPKEITNKFTGEKMYPSHWHDLKYATESRYYERFLRYMRRIINYDIKILQKEASFVICLWDLAAGKGAGTQSELTYAYLGNIPVYCVQTCEMPAWAEGCCTKIFKTFEELYEFLDEEFGG
jgi:hypothetical protein